MFPGLTPLPSHSDSVCTSLGLLLVPGLSLCLALLDIVCRLKTLSCPRITLCLVCVVPVCHYMNLACFVTLSLNKSLANGSACLSSRWLHNRILSHTRIQRLFKWTMARHGYCKTVISHRTGHKIYIQEYLNIAYYSDLPDCVLMDFFGEGINQLLISRLTLEGPRSSLGDFYLLCFIDCWFSIHCGRNMTPHSIV